MVIKKSLITAAAVLLTLSLSGCGARTIPPSEVYLVPPEPEQVEYIAKPPDELAKRLFSAGVSEQSKEVTWSNARGKWVVWKGDVYDIEPKLKPSRIVFLHEYEIPPMSFDSGQFGIIVEFDPAWTEHLKQVTPGQTVYYRAKLVAREVGLFVGRYGLGLGSGFLMLEDGQIIDSTDIAAKLVDLAYTSYQQLDKLVEEAKSIAMVSNYFEQRLNPDWIRVQMVLNLLPLTITIPDKPGVASQDILAPILGTKTRSKAEIQANLEDALTYLHLGTAPPAEEHYLRQFLQQKFEINSKLVSEIERDAQPLKEMYKEARQLPGLEDALKAVGRHMKLMKPILIAHEALERYQDAKAAEQAIIRCYYLLNEISEYMEQITMNVVRACQLVYRQ